MTPEMQIFSVIIWIIILKFIQISIWPLLKSPLGRFSYGISYPASLIVFALLSWYCGLFHLPVHFALVFFVVLLFYYFYKGEYTKKEIFENIRWDIVFFLFFLFMLEVRYLNPSISYAEKFMDHAFLASIINNPTVPPVDPWYSGGNLDIYYYLGHWIFGSLGVISGIKSTIVFNLILPTVLANTAVSLYAIGRLLLNRYEWLLLFPLFIANPAFIYHLILGKSIQTVIWDSTRTIDAAITEYPVFSMLWGDPHAHVISFFNQALFLFLLIFCYMKWNESDEKTKWILAVLLSISLGSMPLLNTWDVLIYAPVLLLTGILIFFRNKNRNEDKHKNTPDKSFLKSDLYLYLTKALPLKILIIVPVLSVIIYLPYYLMLNTSGVEGIGIVHAPTSPFAFILVYGFFLAVLYLECLNDLKKRPWILAFLIPFGFFGYIGAGLCVVPALALVLRKNRTAQDILGSLGLLIIIFTEIIYLKDNMGDDYFRMNTVFKFSLIAWMMLGISCFTFIGKYLDKKFPKNSKTEISQKMVCQNQTWPDKIKSPENKKCAYLLGIAICVILILPVLLPDMNYGYGGKTLDGMDWIKTHHPYDYEAIEFLRSLNGTVNIVEAENNDYTYYSRVSSMTGYPTIIGMPFHEQMWRGDLGLVGERMSDVRKIYENPDDCISLMKKYGMTHIFVGKSEDEIYNVNLPYNQFKEIFRNEGATIYALY